MANRHTRLILSLGALLLALVAQGFAKPLESTLPPPSGVVVVSARVEGRPATFLLDTGAERSCLDASFAEHLQFKPTNVEGMRQPYGNRAVSSLRVRELGIDSFELQNVEMLAADLTSLSMGSGISIDGILGSDVLKRFTVRIDFSSGLVRFGTDAGESPGGVAVPLQPVHNLYFVPLSIQGTPVSLLLDTGANASSVSSHAWSGITMHWQPQTTIDGVRSTGGSEARFALIPTIEIAGAMSRDVPLRVQPQTKDGLFADAGFNGLLGTDVLRQFIVTLDLANNRMYLTSNPKARADRYLFSTIGIQFVKDAQDGFTIMAVWKPSPAARAGLKIGDRIIAVNQLDAHQMSLDDLSREIHGRPGTKINLVIDSDGLRHSVPMATSCLLCPLDAVRDKAQ
jgi:predicted aspartyl protease